MDRNKALRQENEQFKVANQKLLEKEKQHQLQSEMLNNNESSFDTNARPSLLISDDIENQMKKSKKRKLNQFEQMQTSHLLSSSNNSELHS